MTRGSGSIPRFVRFALTGMLVSSAGCNERKDEPSPAKSQKPEPEPDAAIEQAAGEAPPVRKDGTVYAETRQMGTRVSINVWLGPKREPLAAKQAMEAAFEEIERLEDILSEWRPKSELSRLNQAAASGMKQPLKVSPELLEVLRQAKAVSATTGGAFDVTFHGVGQLWSFEPGSRPPSREAVAQNLDLVDWQAMELDAEGRTVLLAKPGMKIGLGAIGKGHAVDRASALLRARGFTDHIVEAGGDTYVSGTKAGKPWVVGVQAPGRRGTVGVLPARNEAIVTSGDYQRFFEHDGKRYAHILDPRTGWPIERADAARSVTIVADDAATADAYCTAVAVMGREAGQAFVREQPGLQGVLIGQTGEVWVSPGLRDRYVPTPDQSMPPTR